MPIPDRLVSSGESGSRSYVILLVRSTQLHDFREPLLMIRAIWFLSGLILLAPSTGSADEAAIPRPEHPRPDAMRVPWANLNGQWEFRFDPMDSGLRDGWEKPGATGYDRTIVVPFPWESKLSGIQRPQGRRARRGLYTI
jgi:hypothetical protein